MQNKFKYTTYNRFCFYLSYIFYKLCLPIEVYEPRFKILFLEFQYSINNFLGHFFSLNRINIFKNNNLSIRTRFGNFKLRKDTLDMFVASPAFERRDVNFLLKQIDKSISQKKRTLFIDIGADLGYYSVIVLNHNKSKLLNVVSFEPVKSSFKLLRENLAINFIKNRIKVFNLGLLDKPRKKMVISLNIEQPGSSSFKFLNENTEIIEISTIDKIISSDMLNKYDHFIFKIDTEGCESEIIKGSKKLLSSEKKVTIMVEDFVNQEIVSTLEKNNGKFICKLTDYNSWWAFN